MKGRNTSKNKQWHLGAEFLVFEASLDSFEGTHSVQFKMP